MKEIVDMIDVDLVREITKNLVEMDSQNPPGKCSHLAEYLREKGESLGFKSTLYKMDKDRHNIILKIGKGKRDVVVSGHLDTVPFGDESKWKYPPLKMTEVDGKLFGRGTVDMKGGVASLIAVMDAINRSDIELTHKIVFAGTADEEVGMHGAFHLKESGVMDNAECVIITEATNLKVGIAEKGPVWIKIKVKGKAAHGSMPEEGENAIYGACKVISKLQELIPQDQNELLGKTTLNVGVIEGGIKVNVVPEECYFDCDYRLIPEVNLQNFLKSIESIITEINNSNSFKAEYELAHSIPALRTDKNEPIVKNMLKWSEIITKQKQEPIGLTYGTDAAALIPPKDIPFIIYGGGSPEVLHQVNEYVVLDDLVKAAKVITGSIIDTYSSEK